ncbi:MAG: flagellar protein FlaG [Pseudohongiellaceae bacterium]
MANVKQTDVASDQNSGKSISQSAKSGNNSPPSSRLTLNTKPSKLSMPGLRPHTEPVSGSINNEGESMIAVGSKTSARKGENEQLRSQSIASAVTALNDFVQSERRDFEFSVSEEEGVSVIRIVDRKSGELIRQIPGDEVFDLARKLNGREPLRLFSALV